MIIPTHLQIETINGICTAKCTMCTIDSWKRKPNVMNLSVYTDILKRYLPYQKNLKCLSLFGFGEPLLDPSIVTKVEVAKSMGFRSVGFASNCTELDYATSGDLLLAGLDTLIPSIDGVNKDTHEAIRIGVNFNQVVNNVLMFLARREMIGHTKVVVRFTKQKANETEWPEFKELWESRLDKYYGDMVICHDVIDVGGQVPEYEDKKVSAESNVPCVCPEIYNRMSVHSDGKVALCCAEANGIFELGNVLEADPIELFNGEVFRRHRRLMEEGRIEELELCNTCTIPKIKKEA